MEGAGGLLEAADLVISADGPTSAVAGERRITAIT